MIVLKDTQADAASARMSSLEVAEITHKQHGNVLRDIRNMVQLLQNSMESYVCESVFYTASNGQKYEMLEMDKETTICLLTGYDAVSRMKVIKRWQQLEEQQAVVYVLPQTKAEALRQLADASEREEALQLQLAQAKPAVDFYEQVGESKDAIPVAEAAKLLSMGPIKLFEFLRREKIFMDGTGGQHRNMPYQVYIDRQYFTVKETPFTTPDGKTYINAKPLVLQKGLEYISKRITASL